MPLGESTSNDTLDRPLGTAGGGIGAAGLTSTIEGPAEVGLPLDEGLPVVVAERRDDRLLDRRIRSPVTSR